MRLHLVGHDGTDHGNDALALARTLAAGRDVRRVVVHVLPRSGPTEPAGEAAIHALGAAAGERVARIRLALSGEETLEVVLAASPARGLHDLAEARSADLVVVAERHRRTTPLNLPIGSVASSLLSGGPCAVAHAPAGYAGVASPLERIVVGFDGSEEARDALTAAAELAAASHALVDVVHAYDHTAYPRYAGTVAEAEQAADRLVAEALAAMPVGVRGVSASRSGTAGSVIEAFGAEQQAGLIVLGSRGYGPVLRTLLGSTGSHVLHQAHRPILFLPRSTAVTSSTAASIGLAIAL